ncbi:MAG TPA: SPOR domain-containing protein [Gammaproteobacteria bacterium]|nr:SPOR domain-containing protein [Gammaproteobacteria bacterium]
MIEEKLKQRLVGATVLVGLGVIFIPMLLDNSGNSGVPESAIKTPSRSGDSFTSAPLAEKPAERAPSKLEEPPSLPARVEPPRLEAVSPVKPAKERVAPEEVLEVDPAQAGGDWGSKAAQGVSKAPALPPAAKAEKQAGTHVVQLASFSSEEKAVALKTQLRKRGYNAFVERIPVRGGKLFRVRIGPLSQLKAKQLQAKLAKDINLQGMVIRSR